MADASWLASLSRWAKEAFADLPDLALAAAAAMAGAMAGVLALRSRARSATPDGAPDLADDCVFLWRGNGLRPANAAAADLLFRIGGTEPEGRQLSAWMERQEPGLAARLDEALAGGEPFVLEFATADGRHLELRARLQGAFTVLTLREVSEARRRELAATARLSVLESDHAALSALLDAVPVPMWRSRPGEGVVWANAAYRALASRVAEEAPLPALFAGPTGIDLSAEGRPRRAALPGQDGEHGWFELTERDLGAAGVGGCAVNVDVAVRAEAALKRFVETLTETFAHLPTGLAVFDKNRRLGLFNPAMSDILKLDPAWLASRPTLREFLERLRENRQMPDQPDFLAWRSKLTALERDAEEAAYEEDWVLPSGQTLHVTGRPHPQGAIAFLFEDISSAITLERRYRAEIETLRAVLHKLPEAVALFRPDGTLALANTAMRGIWGFEAGLDQPAPHISRLIERWAAACEPGPVWRRLRDFATGQDARAPWSARLLLLDGRMLHARFSPLPDGSTLASFSDETERERLQADLRDARADLESGRRLLHERLGELRRRVEAGQPGSALAADLAAAAIAIDPGTEEALSGAPPPELPATELPALVEAVARLSPAAVPPVADFAVAGDLPGLSRRRLRQLLHGLLTEAEAQRGGEGPAHLSIATRGGTLTLSVRVPGPGEPEPGLSAAILRRLVRLEGGTLTVEGSPDGTERVLRCVIPLREAPPRAAGQPA